MSLRARPWSSSTSRRRRSGRRPPAARAGDQRVQHPYAVGAVPALLRRRSSFARVRGHALRPARRVAVSGPCSQARAARLVHRRARRPAGGVLLSLGAREEPDAALATIPQLMEVGRLLARLHQLARRIRRRYRTLAIQSRSSPLPGRGRARHAVRVVETPLPPLPSGAGHGGLTPRRALFLGDRCSAILPSGLAGSGALVLDLAEAALGWMSGSPRPSAALRALTSGYQALRRLFAEERTRCSPRCGLRRGRRSAPSLHRPARRADGLRAVNSVGSPKCGPGG